ncbi:MAG: putative toxin-antitoxin system toxin component, PIN family [Rhodospirillales bacterium]|nr:putative toxin-antitoxin system toxin component, PIN family [Rhodospirillales bacterium]
MSRLRVVLDTNVLLSALLFEEGRLAWLRRAWQDGILVPLLSRATAEELLRVLKYPKFRLSPAECDELLADVLPFCESVSIDDPPANLPPCRNVDDRMFLEVAVQGRADALVTGDADLLALAGAFAIPIITPAQLRDRMRAHEE